jgi:hypothetical protein
MTIQNSNVSNFLAQCLGSIRAKTHQQPAKTAPLKSIANSLSQERIRFSNARLPYALGILPVAQMISYN